MRVAALISGGKDSCFNMMQCVAQGHTIVALANLRPKDKDELDSYMFQTVGHHAIELYAEAMGLPLFRRTIEGGSVNRSRDYETTLDDEVEDLYQLLSQIKEEVDYEAVSVGAILSDYQRVRVEHVCLRLGVTPLAYLWRRDQTELLAEMIQCGVNAVVIKVASLGLSPDKHLGKSLPQIYPHMLNMCRQYGVNPCGEGGEYETFTLDCPVFKKSIVVDDQEMVMHSDDPFSPVAYLNFKSMHLKDKECVPESQQERIKDLKMKQCNQILDELYPDACLPKSDPDHFQKEEDACLNCTLRRLESVSTFQRKSGSGWFYCSGIVGMREDGATVEEQTQVAMERLKGILTKQEVPMSTLVAVHVYVKNMTDFARINSIYKTYFGINPPIRICVEADLPSNVSLQLDAIAHHSEKSAQPKTIYEPNRMCDEGDAPSSDTTADHSGQTSRRTMHVQSLSHWAPANIGPYSQCVQINDFRVYVAGQIPLVPGSMQIVEGGIYPQARLSLRHVDRVLRAIRAPTAAPSHIGCVRLAICYVTSHRFIQAAEKEWREQQKRTSQEESTSAENTCDLVEYVVISHLPRDALIEWHVYAVPSNAQSTGGLSSRRGKATQASCACSHSQYYDDFAVSLICTLESTNEIADDYVLSQEETLDGLVTSLKCIHDTIRGLVKDRGGDKDAVDPLSELGVLRIFYAIRHFDINYLEKEYTKAWSDCTPEEYGLSPPAFVPVRTFRDTKQLLSICH